jgi:hypothetical protein
MFNGLFNKKRITTVLGSSPTSQPELAEAANPGIVITQEVMAPFITEDHPLADSPAIEPPPIVNSGFKPSSGVTTLGHVRPAITLPPSIIETGITEEVFELFRSASRIAVALNQIEEGRYSITVHSLPFLDLKSLKADLIIFGTQKFENEQCCMIQGVEILEENNGFYRLSFDVCRHVYGLHTFQAPRIVTALDLKVHPFFIGANNPIQMTLDSMLDGIADKLNPETFCLECANVLIKVKLNTKLNYLQLMLLGCVKLEEFWVKIISYNELSGGGELVFALQTKKEKQNQ